MAQKLNTEIFIQRAVTMHGNKYDYSKVQYKNIDTPVTIICSIHGEFNQVPYIHLKGANCKKCTDAINTINQKSNTKEFIKKALILHGDKYLYDNVNYINSATPVEIICKEHGIFKCTPNNHLFGKGCRICGREKLYRGNRKDLSYYIEKANKIHDNKYTYDYAADTFNGYMSDIIVTCPIHGNFLTSVVYHITNKKCCPECSGIPAGGKKFSKSSWAKGKEHLLKHVYLIKLFNLEESFLKIGITTQEFKSRFSGIPYNYQLLYNYSSYSADIIWDIEKHILKEFKNFKYKPALPFGGSTECLLVNKDEIINKIDYLTWQL